MNTTLETTNLNPDFPVIRLGPEVDVTNINKEKKMIHFSIYLKCLDHELQSEDIKYKIKCLTKEKVQYLIHEGFIKHDVWNLNVNVINSLQ